MTSWKFIEDAPKCCYRLGSKAHQRRKMLPIIQSLVVGITGNGKLRQTF
jgi:hypothetical protein